MKLTVFAIGIAVPVCALIIAGSLVGHAMFGEPPLPTQKVIRVDLSKAQQDEIVIEISTNLVTWVKVCTFHAQTVWASTMEIEAETTNNCFLRQRPIK